VVMLDKRTVVLIRYDNVIQLGVSNWYKNVVIYMYQMD